MKKNLYIFRFIYLILFLVGIFSLLILILLPAPGLPFYWVGFMLFLVLGFLFLKLYQSIITVYTCPVCQTKVKLSFVKTLFHLSTREDLVLIYCKTCKKKELFQTGFKDEE